MGLFAGPQRSIQDTKKKINPKELKRRKSEPIIVLFESFEVESHFTLSRTLLIAPFIRTTIFSLYARFRGSWRSGLQEQQGHQKWIDHGRARNFTETNPFNTLQEGPFVNVKGTWLFAFIRVHSRFKSLSFRS